MSARLLLASAGVGAALLLLRGRSKAVREAACAQVAFPAEGKAGLLALPVLRGEGAVLDSPFWGCAVSRFAPGVGRDAQRMVYLMMQWREFVEEGYEGLAALPEAAPWIETPDFRALRVSQVFLRPPAGWRPKGYETRLAWPSLRNAVVEPFAAPFDPASPSEDAVRWKYCTAWIGETHRALGMSGASTSDPWSASVAEAVLAMQQSRTLRGEMALAHARAIPRVLVGVGAGVSVAETVGDALLDRLRDRIGGWL